MRWTITILIAVSSLSSLCLSVERKEPHRSPIDLALVPGGPRALTANHTSDSVSLVDLHAGTVLAERSCGKKPAAVACSRDGKRAAVSNLWSNTVTLLEVRASSLEVIAELPVGALPRGLVFAPDGGTLYIALAGGDEVACLDWNSRKITHRWSAPREPRELALSADGHWLVAASSRSAQVRCWDTTNRKLAWERRIEDGFNLRGLTFSPDGKDVLCGHALRREFPVSQHHIDAGWVIDNRLSKFPLAADARYEHWQLALDLRGEAAADAHGSAFSPDGRWLVVAASGTHELLVLEPGHLPWSPAEPGDFIDVTLEIGPHKMRRLPLGGRPLTVAFSEGSQTVAVVNYLLDAVQVVDLPSGKLVRSIPLGGPAEMSPARQGEAIFYDARRSHHQWFSCHTCHTDGHTNGLKFDTLNDDSYGNPKLTLTLRNVTRTAPYTWHGWQQDLRAAVTKSMTETMFGPRPRAADVDALIAFLGTLDHPPNPHRGPNGAMNAAAQRGKAIFDGKARCVRCHKGDLYYSEHNYDVKLGDDGSPYDLWNPPSLLGVWDRGPYLHDSRAATLEELLRIHHSSEKLGGAKLTDAELRDLIEFLIAL